MLTFMKQLSQTILKNESFAQIYVFLTIFFKSILLVKNSHNSFSFLLT